jgi:hypothetical protein
MLDIQPTDVEWDEDAEQQAPAKQAEPAPKKGKKPQTGDLTAQKTPDFGQLPGEKQPDEYGMIDDDLPFDFSEDQQKSTGWGKNMNAPEAEQPPEIPSFAITAEPTQPEPEQKPIKAKPAWGVDPSSKFDPNDF